MIAILLIIVAAFGALGLTTARIDADPPEPPTTVVITPDPGDAPLTQIEARRTGGVGYQDLSVAIDDPAALAALQGLLPQPLPQGTGPTGVCADCWLYHVELQFDGFEGPVVLDYDQANEPPELSAFFDALDPYLEGNPTPPDSTSLDDVPPQGSMERVDVVRSGGLDGMTVQASVEDGEALGLLAAAAPYPLPEIDPTPSGCADCFVYEITVRYRGVEEPTVLRFDESQTPPELAGFLQILGVHLEQARHAG